MGRKLRELTIKMILALVCREIRLKPRNFGDFQRYPQSAYVSTLQSSALKSTEISAVEVCGNREETNHSLGTRTTRTETYAGEVTTKMLRFVLQRPFSPCTPALCLYAVMSDPEKLLRNCWR